ncbi:MAG: phosphoenolpyruvate carboxykinase (ATP), partial [Longimicrobiales bacterium]
GYTAKVAGTERGVTEPKAAFSTCFAAPFLPLPPSVYARMLGGKLDEHDAQCWLVNTGWTGGPPGIGQRMRLGFTRRMVDAVLSGALHGVETRTDPVFGLHVPKHVPGVPDEVLDPRATWTDGSAYDAQAAKLANMFRENFRNFESEVSESVREGGRGRSHARRRNRALARDVAPAHYRRVCFGNTVGLGARGAAAAATLLRVDRQRLHLPALAR